MEGDTPLHSAVRWINSLSASPENLEYGSSLIAMMLEAGSDPRIRNKARLTPYDLTDPSNVALRKQLADAVDIMQNAGDFVVDDESSIREVEDENLGDGSASDSDFDPEDFRKEKERRKMTETNGKKT